MFTVTLKTTREHLETMSKADLLKVIADNDPQAPVIRGATKADLVADVWARIVAPAQAKLAAAEEAHIQARAATLAAEAADGVKVACLTAAVAGVAKKLEEQQTNLDAAKAKLAEDPIYNLTWKADDLFEAHALVNAFTGLHRYLAAPERLEQTLAEIDEALADNADYHIRQVLNASMSQSTSPWTNARTLAEHKAAGQFAKVAKQVASSIKERRTEALLYSWYF